MSGAQQISLHLSRFNSTTKQLPHHLRHGFSFHMTLAHACVVLCRAYAVTVSRDFNDFGLREIVFGKNRGSTCIIHALTFAVAFATCENHLTGDMTRPNTNKWTQGQWLINEWIAISDHRNYPYPQHCWFLILGHLLILFPLKTIGYY